MEMRPISRKKFLTGSSAAVAGAVLSGSAKKKTEEVSNFYQGGRSPWPIALSTSTIRPSGDIAEKVSIAAETGYDGIEVWEGELNDYEDRKSTRLNSSHVATSYAVFCLKRKNV